MLRELRQAAAMAASARRGRAFGVNVLSAGQRDLSRWFANRHRLAGATMFDGVPFEKDPTGCPILVDATASFDCRLRQSHPAGDHLIVLGEVVALVHRPRSSHSCTSSDDAGGERPCRASPSTRPYSPAHRLGCPASALRTGRCRPRPRPALRHPGQMRRPAACHDHPAAQAQQSPCHDEPCVFSGLMSGSRPVPEATR